MTSKALSSLKKQAGELQKLLKDLKRTESQSSLDTVVEAKESMGPYVKVHRWALIEHFLFSFVEWNQLYSNYLRYFGQAEQMLPTRLQKLRYNCDRFRHALLFASSYEGLPARLSEEWRPVKTMRQKVNSDAVELYHEFVQADLRSRAAGIYRWEAASADNQISERRFSGNQSVSWHDLASAMSDRAQDPLEQSAGADDTTRYDVRRFLRNYRHATLRMSWLEEKWQRSASDLLLQTNGTDKGHVSLIDRYLQEIRRMNLPNDLYQLAEMVVHRIADAVQEIGYENFVNDIISPDFNGGDESPVGIRNINVIPGKGAARCCPILLAVSRGPAKKGRLGFSRIMQQVKVQLIECAGITRVVIVLCDTWDVQSFMHEHYDELRAHYQKDVRFLFLVIGVPDSSLSPIDIKF